MTDNPTMQDVLRQFYPQYLESHGPDARQAKTANHILGCRTGAYGHKRELKQKMPKIRALKNIYKKK